VEACAARLRIPLECMRKVSESDHAVVCARA
jgi:hypothetical protein